MRFLEERFVERSYYDRPEGRFACGDTLLERIWNTGIETYKACSEDALIDNPTRERGQWLGDVGIVGMEIGAAGFSDIAIVRRRARPVGPVRRQRGARGRVVSRRRVVHGLLCAAMGSGLPQLRAVDGRSYAARRVVRGCRA